MRRLNGLVQCVAVYPFSIEVPSHLTLPEAIEYAKEQIDEIPVGILEYVCGNDEIDEERCEFAE